MANKIDNYKTRDCLKKLSKNELINLVLRFASQSFIDNINGQFSTKKEALSIFYKSSQAIEGVLSDEELLYNPDGFEQELLKHLEKIKALWDKLPIQVGELIIRIIESVEQSFDNGYLYIENYGEKDDYFESEDVNEYIYQFTKNLPKEMKFAYIEKLKKYFNNCGYSTFLSIEKKISKIK